MYFKKIYNNTKVMINYFKSEIMAFFDTPKFLKYFFIAILLYLIAVSGIFLGNFYYNDDWVRSIERGVTWDNDARFIPSFLVRMVTNLSLAPDFFPVLYIFGLIIMAIISLLFLYLLGIKFGFFAILATMPLVINPRSMQILLYRYDNFNISLSFLLILFPFLFRKNLVLFSFFSFVCLILMNLTYQATNGGYVIMLLFFAFIFYFFEQKTAKDSAKFIFFGCISYIFANLIAKIIFTCFATPAVVKTSKILPIDQNLIGEIYFRMKFFTKSVMDFFYGSMSFYILLILFILSLICLVVKSYRSKLQTFVFVILFFLIAFYIWRGSYLILEHLRTTGRFMIGFNFVMTLICVIPFMINKFNLIKKVAIFVLICGFISYINATANASVANLKYQDFRVNMLIQDMNRLASKEKSVILLNGKFSHSKAAEFYFKRYKQWGSKTDNGNPITVLNYFSKVHYEHKKFPHIIINDEKEFKRHKICENVNLNSFKNIVAEVNNFYHSIKKIDRCYLVEFY